MTTTAKASGRSYASLKLQKKVPALITQAQNIVQAIPSPAARRWSGDARFSHQDASRPMLGKVMGPT